MEWKIMSKTEAAAETENWLAMERTEFKKLVHSWGDNIIQNLDEDYIKLRMSVLDVCEQCKKKMADNSAYSKKKDYFFDLFFGIELYKIFEQFGFNIRMASNDQIWIYLSVKVFPDLVYCRYPGGKVKTNYGLEYRNINVERFYKSKRRIYLKVIWWYIYLSLQKDQNGMPDYDKTLDILRNNSTDEIVQIVERSGKTGYRTEVYRGLMRFYANHRNIYDNKRFRQVMVLNTARTQVVEPELMINGVEAYIEELFTYFDKK